MCNLWNVQSLECGTGLLQQLKGQLEVMPRYFAGNQGEVDFVLQCGTAIIPVEVSSDT